MHDFAEVYHGSVIEAVSYPTAKAGFGFGGVLAAYCRVVFPRSDLYTFSDDLESSLHPFRPHHFVCLASVSGIKGRAGKERTATSTFMGACGVAEELLIKGVHQNVFSLA